MRTVALMLSVALGVGWTNLAGAQGSQIVHDAEYYILEAQNGEKWAAEDACRIACQARHTTQHHPYHVGRHVLRRRRDPRD